MIDRETALHLVENIVGKMPYKSSHDPEDRLIVVNSSTLEFENGYVFFWTSKKYFETREFKYALAGNSPYIVDKRDGTLHMTGTAHRIEYYIDQFNQSRP